MSSKKTPRKQTNKQWKQTNHANKQKYYQTSETDIVQLQQEAIELINRFLGNFSSYSQKTDQIALAAIFFSEILKANWLP